MKRYFTIIALAAACVIPAHADDFQDRMELDRRLNEIRNQNQQIIEQNERMERSRRDADQAAKDARYNDAALHGDIMGMINRNQ